jgi:hypothetical protein
LRDGLAGAAKGEVGGEDEDGGAASVQVGLIATTLKIAGSCDAGKPTSAETFAAF